MLRRLIAVPRARARWLANIVLAPLDTAAGRRAHPADCAPIFIVGAPRCGSTLLYQLLISRFDVGYISNRLCRTWGWPAIGVRLGRGPRHLRRATAESPANSEDAFSSTHGRTQGDDGPSECGNYWYRFFPRSPHAVTRDDVSRRTERSIRGAVMHLCSAFGRPIVFKNLYCSERLDVIRAALPDAIFIHITRDEVANAHSILEGRKAVHGTYDEWWSLEPRDIDRLRALPVAEQVLGQVRAINDDVLAAVGADSRYLHVSYEALCADVHAVLDTIEQHAARCGAPLTVRGSVPATFALRNEVRIDATLYDTLRTLAAAR